MYTDLLHVFFNDIKIQVNQIRYLVYVLCIYTYIDDFLQNTHNLIFKFTLH